MGEWYAVEWNGAQWSGMEQIRIECCGVSRASEWPFPPKASIWRLLTHSGPVPQKRGLVQQKVTGPPFLMSPRSTLWFICTCEDICQLIFILFLIALKRRGLQTARWKFWWRECYFPGNLCLTRFDKYSRISNLLWKKCKTSDPRVTYGQWYPLCCAKCPICTPTVMVELW